MINDALADTNLLCMIFLAVGMATIDHQTGVQPCIFQEEFSLTNARGMLIWFKSTWQNEVAVVISGCFNNRCAARLGD